ncbi:MAG: SRPBCC domain-containing protein [Candidatus Saccharimonadales bacterium]
MTETTVTKKPETFEIILERTFAAPAEKVFGAFKDADALAQWWGPSGWTTESKVLDFTPGGKWHYGMKCIDESQGEWFGKTSWGMAVYRDIDEPNSFSYKDYFSNEAGEINEDMPTIIITNTFKEVDGATKVTSSSLCPSKQDYDTLVNMGMIEGASQTWDRLEEYVTKD